EKVKDEYTDTAIWDGKKGGLVPGTLHPNCRGGWLPWGGKEADAMLAKHDGKSAEWDKAAAQVREEYKAKGVGNPQDQTKGYTERINEVDRGELEKPRQAAEGAGETETLSPARKRTEASRLALEQANKEGLSGEAWTKRLRELYLKNCAELGVSPE
ncbi:MAG: hypothetical protein LBG87_00755, partial [Spirochaetaceae bacterium]|nr:hypothetical protein [Spirochaetaceae bacterium]